MPAAVAEAGDGGTKSGEVDMNPAKQKHDAPFVGAILCQHVIGLLYVLSALAWPKTYHVPTLACMAWSGRSWWEYWLSSTYVHAVLWYS